MRNEIEIEPILLYQKAVAKSLSVSVGTVGRWRAMPNGLPFSVSPGGSKRLFNPIRCREWVEGYQNPKPQQARLAVSGQVFA